MYTPYRLPQKSYEAERALCLQDFTGNIPHKRTELLPHLFNSGVYGFTYPNLNYMARDRDLHPDKARETDIHELIHTTDEYETRVLTKWMLSKEDKQYIH